MAVITLYDVPSTLKVTMISPSAGKLRLLLDYKNIPYQTEWIDFPEVEATAKAVGAPPTGKRADGNPKNTILFITISSQGKPTLAMSNSIAIAEYMEKTYADPEHRLLPAETRVFPVYVHGIPVEHDPERDVQAKTRATFYGKSLLESLPKDEASFAEAWEGFENAFDDLAAHLDKAGKGNYRVTGDVSYSEFELGTLLNLVKRLVYEDRWKNRLETRNGGRWAKLMNLPVYKELLAAN